MFMMPAGIKTWSITWMTPLLHRTSAVVTVAMPTFTVLPLTETGIEDPCNVTNDVWVITWEAIRSPETTWYSSN